MLFVVSLLDSAAVFLPPEPLLIAMAVARPNLSNLSVFYAIIATVTYYVGRLGGRLLAERFVKRQRIETAEDFFQDHGTLTTLMAAGISHLGI